MLNCNALCFLIAIEFRACWALKCVPKSPSIVLFLLSHGFTLISQVYCKCIPSHTKNQSILRSLHPIATTCNPPAICGLLANASIARRARTFFPMYLYQNKTYKHKIQGAIHDRKLDLLRKCVSTQMFDITARHCQPFIACTGYAIGQNIGCTQPVWVHLAILILLFF